jgi:hypothetical protein
MEFEESLGNSHHREDVALSRIHSSSVADASAPSAG